MNGEQKKNLTRTRISQATTIHDVFYWYMRVCYLGWYFFNAYIYIDTIVCIDYTPQMLYIIKCLLQTKKGIQIPLYAQIVLPLFPGVSSCQSKHFFQSKSCYPYLKNYLISLFVTYNVFKLILIDFSFDKK